MADRQTRARPKRGWRSSFMLETRLGERRDDQLHVSGAGGLAAGGMVWGHVGSLRPISRAVAEELAEILGLGTGGWRFPRMVDEVADALTSYPGLVIALEKAPRPSQVVAALDELEQAVERVVALIERDLESATKTHVDIRMGLARKGVEPRPRLDSVASELRHVMKACARERQANERLESRGRPGKGARKLVVGDLCGVFEKYATRKARQAAKNLDLLKVDFVRTACRVAHIPLPTGKNAVSEIIRLIRASRENMS